MDVIASAQLPKCDDLDMSFELFAFFPQLTYLSPARETRSVEAPSLHKNQACRERPGSKHGKLIGFSVLTFLSPRMLNTLLSPAQTQRKNP